MDEEESEYLSSGGTILAGRGDKESGSLAVENAGPRP
jgi:hypothetical protein